MARTSSNTMPSLVRIVRRAPAADEKVWCFLLPAGLREAQPCRYCFIARQHTDARYWYSKSVCPSVCPLRSGIGWKRLNNYFHSFFTTR